MGNGIACIAGSWGPGVCILRIRLSAWSCGCRAGSNLRVLRAVCTIGCQRWLCDVQGVLVWRIKLCACVGAFPPMCTGCFGSVPPELAQYRPVVDGFQRVRQPSGMCPRCTLLCGWMWLRLCLWLRLDMLLGFVSATYPPPPIWTCSSPPSSRPVRCQLSGSGRSHGTVALPRATG